jgi:hypothetical protein
VRPQQEETRIPTRDQQVASAGAPNYRAGSSSCNGGARGGRGSGRVGREAQVPEDAFFQSRVLDQREQPQPAATTRAIEHVDPEPHQLARLRRYGSQRFWSPETPLKALSVNLAEQVTAGRWPTVTEAI